MERTIDARKRSFLVGIRDEKMPVSEADSLLKELSRLADTLELEVLATEIVHLRGNNAKFGMGTGKAEELAEKAASLEVDCIVFDREISPSQQRNWEDLTGIPVIDRQELIIQIFAGRARTREAELQVRLAELIYSLPRLQHKYIDLSRQRGGRYGARDSGETRLETDRRLVEKRIHRLEEELEQLKRQRQVQRKKRERSGIPVCALVGYTNAGKSSILNALTGAAVFAEDKLFATLDPTSRRLHLPLGTEILLVDTVGFIRRLPHSLIKAFRSTLEEARCGDLILNVLDASDPDAEIQYETTLSVLGELNAGEIPMITVLNKIDKVESSALFNRYPGSVAVSALKGSGLSELCTQIESCLALQKKYQKKGA
jgi:GTP-binding protein HflX